MTSIDLPDDQSITVATDAGMHALWSPELFPGINDYNSWEAELLEDEDIERHIRAGALVPINIGSDGAFAFTVRIGAAAKPAELTDREARYRVVSSQAYRLQCRDRACLSGIEHIEAAPSEGRTHALALTVGQYDVTVHLLDWKAEPDAKTTDGAPVDGALPDFVVLINPPTQDQITYRTSVWTFDRPA